MSGPTISVWRRHVGWHPGDLSWRAGVAFMVGSTCFALGSLPFFFLNVPAGAVGATFFVGSVFFTAAGVTQLTQASRGQSQVIRHRAWWAVVIQLIGMLFFNVNTYRAAFARVPADEINRLVWAPDFFGSIAFLVASHLVWLDVCGPRLVVDRESPDWWMAALNYTGSIFFMLAAIGSYTISGSGNIVSLTVTNMGTFLGAVCFFVAAYLLLPRGSTA